MSIAVILLFGIIVLITHLMEGITGFGCTVLALPFAIALVGINVAVPVLIVLAWFLCLYIVIIDFKKIVWKEFFKIISFVILGLPIGMWIFSSMSEAILKNLLGIFMILVALRGLYISFVVKPKQQDNQPAELNPSRLKKYLLNVLLFLGGIVHGAFSSGGPFVVIYASQSLPDKSNFRATLCTMWVILNGILTFNNVRTGVLAGPTLELTLWTFPFLAAGALLGNYAHNNIKGDTFVKLVYIVLLLSGAFMFR